VKIDKARSRSAVSESVDAPVEGNACQGDAGLKAVPI
jgi:hypothetical protein